MGKGSGRPGGNPDFGTKYKFDFGNKEVRDQALTIRFSARELAEIKEKGGDDYRDLCRKAILEAIQAM